MNFKIPSAMAAFAMIATPVASHADTLSDLVTRDPKAIANKSEQDILLECSVATVQNNQALIGNPPKFQIQPDGSHRVTDSKGVTTLKATSNGVKITYAGPNPATASPDGGATYTLIVPNNGKKPSLSFTFSKKGEVFYSIDAAGVSTFSSIVSADRQAAMHMSGTNHANNLKVLYNGCMTNYVMARALARLKTDPAPKKP